VLTLAASVGDAVTRRLLVLLVLLDEGVLLDDGVLFDVCSNTKIDYNTINSIRKK